MTHMWFDSATTKEGHILHDSFVCVYAAWQLRHDSFICETWLIRLCIRGMTDSCSWPDHQGTWHDSFKCVTWLVHVCYKTIRALLEKSPICVRSHVTDMSESWHTWMRHVTHMNESCHRFDWVMSQIWVSTYMNKSCYRYECVMSQILIRHVTHLMSHIWTSRSTMRHVAHMQDSCLMYEWLWSHIWMSMVSHMKGLYHTYEWVMPDTQRSGTLEPWA